MQDSYKHFAILDVQRKEGRKELLQLLLPASEAGNTEPTHTILSFLQKTHSLQTVVIEDPYVDRDYLDEYNNFYSKTFKTYDKHCKRLHFFSCPVSKNDLPDLKKFNPREVNSKAKNYYLGFCIIRPIDAFRIGRTVLAPNNTQPNNHFILSKAEFKPNVAGQRLSIVGAPFMQQDTQVGMCATASLWMATRLLSQKYDLASFSPAEITNLATKYDIHLGRAIPSEGLSVGQICLALKEMGLEPKVHNPQSNLAAKKLIYTYVESEIPVILALGGPDTDGHTVTVVGHSYKSKKRPQKEPLLFNKTKIGSYSHSFEWVDKFFIHDDRIGPYVELQMLNLQKFIGSRRRGLLQPKKLKIITKKPIYIEDFPCPVKVKGDGKIWNIDSIIVPLLPGIHLTAEYIEKKSLQPLLLIKYIYGHPDLNDVVLRSYIESSNNFKARIQEGNMCDTLKHYYGGQPMPKYIWITEISTVDWMNKKNKENRLMMGELILDTTSTPHADAVLSLHVPQLLFDVGPNKKHNEEKIILNPRYINNDPSYTHNVR